MKTFAIFLIFLLAGGFLFAGEAFEIVEIWNHSDELMGYCRRSIINEKGHIVGIFYKTGCRVITPKQIIAFAPRGQGPGDLMDMMGLLHFGKDIAIPEQPDKVKIFENDGDSYKSKEIRWLKRTPYYHFVRNAIYLDNKWFLAGYEMTSLGKTNDPITVYLLKILDEKGQPVKNLVEKIYDEQRQDYNMNYYIVGSRDHAYLLLENELKVHAVSVKDLVDKEVNLEVPVFYKKMPAEFYTRKKYNKAGESMEKDIETWRTSYSIITKAVIAGNYLLLQIRTCSTPAEKLKKFALLFYNLDNFKLEKTIFIDDFLVGYRDGRYYFLAGGNPGLDEEVDDFIVHIYAFRGANEKK